jgi:phosphatidylglycerophosphatase A
VSKPTKVELVFTTVLGSGYFPIAPATVASAVTCVILYFTPQALMFPWYLIVIPVFFIGVWLATRAESIYGHDAGKIVIDEFIGQWITLLPLWRSPSIKSFVVAFFLFRVLDIIKPLGIRASQKAPRGWGVMVDDLLAGILGAVIVFAALRLSPTLFD